MSGPLPSPRTVAMAGALAAAAVAVDQAVRRRVRAIEAHIAAAARMGEGTDDA